MTLHRILFSLFMISTIAACTGRVDVVDLAADPDRDAQKNCVGSACAACILPWGGTLPGGESLNAVYTTELAACGTSCMDNRLEMRCQLAKLQIRRPGQEYVDIGDTKVVRSCWQRRCDCDHGGIKVEDGTNARFYKPGVMTCGTACESKLLTCAGGVMKDAAASNPDPSAASIFTSSLCNNTCRNCTLPDGTTINHGASTARYKAATAPCGTACSSLVLSLSCNDGTLSGNPALYPAVTCANPTNCQTCTTPDGVKLQNGERYSFFRLQNVPCGTSCYANNNQVTLTCASGQFGDRAIYPEHRFASCESACDPTGPKGDLSQGRITGDGGGAPVWFCGLPWGSGVVTHGTQVTAYSRMKVARTDKCANYKSLITCNGYRGLWSGGGVFIYPSCKEDP